MGTLYTIIWRLSDGYEIARNIYLSEEAVKEKMEKNPEWTFRIIECKPHCITWEAK